MLAAMLLLQLQMALLPLWQSVLATTALVRTVTILTTRTLARNALRRALLSSKTLLAPEIPSSCSIVATLTI
jgi:hypothetical protein